MLNKVILIVSISFSHLLMKVEEICKCCGSTLSLNQLSLKLKILVVDDVIVLLLHEHVMHNDTSCHHILHSVHTQCSSKVANNSSPSLEHIKSTLHILFTNLLFFTKPSFLLSIVLGDGIHKSGTRRIDTIS